MEPKILPWNSATIHYDYIQNKVTCVSSFQKYFQEVLRETSFEVLVTRWQKLVSVSKSIENDRRAVQTTARNEHIHRVVIDLRTSLELGYKIDLEKDAFWSITSGPTLGAIIKLSSPNSYLLKSIDIFSLGCPHAAFYWNSVRNREESPQFLVSQHNDSPVNHQFALWSCV